MSKDESKAKMGINFGKSFLEVPPKTTVDYCNDFKLHQFSPWALPLSFPVRKGCCFKQRRHFNRYEIVYLAKINEIVDFIFKISYFMTGIGSHASTHSFAYYISAFKS